ncbi:cytochrome P450, family 96, subfamily A, polypeptide 10 [Actinidia rufa]|uniref:Cytochrome P450, family 96, subfamily A, polypeptide 10 n=1 Tax=Actinidia rufa TaxID=165716 RepID=A0A7J0ELN0_9ERIC|nr:cytochrome P450, family 96, subfamily A, polypeptide 10 [Actinidia rufa]
MVSLGYYEILLALVCFLFLSFFATINGVPWNWPLVGMLPSVFLNVHWIHDWGTHVLRRVGGTFSFKGPWFSNMDMLVTVDPANVHYIMSANFSNFPKGPQFLKIFDFLGDGIFNSDADLWRIQRKHAQLQINHQRFHRFLVKTSQDKVEKWLIPILEHVSKLGISVDLQDLFQRFTFDTTCILVTSYDPGCLSIDLPNVPFSKAMDDAEETLLFRHMWPESIWKLQSWLEVGHEKKLSRAWATIDHIIDKYILMKRDELSKGLKSQKEEEGVDLLTSYLNEDEIMGLKCDNKFLRDTVLNFMIAGRDTVSSALTWFLWLVSTHPIVEVKIREELKAIVPEKEGNKWRVFSIEEVSKLVYLHSALCESLRLYPPVPFQHKEPLKADILPSGHHINPRMKILFSLYAMGRMEFIWGEDCLEFKPERWISERGTVKHEPSYKFLAFNAGPRTCLGKEVAFTQMKVVAAAMIHNYHVQVVEGHRVAPNVSVILYMKHGFVARVTKRWS